MRKLLFANLTDIFFLARMSRLMINQVCFCLKAGITGLTNMRPIIRVHQLMPLKQLFMFEAFVAFVADKTTSIVVFGFLVIQDGTRMI